MNEQPVSLSKVSWRELCPWTIIFRALPVSFSVTILIWALLGVVLTPMGWLISENVFLGNDEIQGDRTFKEMVERNRSPYQSVFIATRESDSPIKVFGTNLSGPMLVFDQLVQPFATIFDRGLNGRQFVYILFGSVWTLLVWSFAGCAITRVSLLRLTRDEPADLDDSFDYARDHFGTCVWALMMPLLAVALICVPLAVFGLLLGFDFGVFLGGIFWFIVLLMSFTIVIFLLGLMFGWPLMISSVSAEGQNAFDAMTRSFAYTFQKPVQYFMYMVIAVLFGGFCWIVVASMTNSTINIGYWATSWGANRFSTQRIDFVKSTLRNAPLADDSEAPSGLTMMQRGQKIIGFWNAVARTVAAAFLYGLFWCMASAIYLLLRKDVDETEMDEVFMLDEKRTYDLPPLKSDENGIPQVQSPEVVERSNDESEDL